jgi:hypothetical protein
MSNKYFINVFTYNFPWIYFLRNHILHLLLGPSQKAREWNIGDPDQVIVLPLVVPENSFHIRIAFNHNVAWAICFLRWDLPLPFWVLLYIFVSSPAVFT